MIIAKILFTETKLRFFWIEKRKGLPCKRERSIIEFIFLNLFQNMILKCINKRLLLSSI